MSLMIGARPSNLSLKQVEEFVEIFGIKNYEVRTYKTPGDFDKLTLIEDAPDDFFIRDLEEALLRGEIDLAVHSAKDLPSRINSGLRIAAITEGIVQTDSLITRNGKKLNELDSGSLIGVSSYRRKNNILKLRRDLRIKGIRGNIEERIEKLDRGEYDGIIVATCALRRLGLDDEITEEFPVEVFSTHPLQGKLAIEVREDNFNLIRELEKLDKRRKILYLCVENSCRSQIAEAITNHFFWNKFSGFSAGSKPSGYLNPLSVELLKNKGLDISFYRSKSIDVFEDIKFSFIITMGCKEICPSYIQSGNPNLIKLTWDISDPNGKDIYFFEKVYNIIEEEIRKL